MKQFYFKTCIIALITLMCGYSLGAYANDKPRAKIVKYKRYGKGCAMVTYEDGMFYMGFLKKRKRNGNGDCKFPDGSIYSGSWMDDYMHGYGVYTWPDGKKYEGDFRYDQRTGHGVFTWPDGDKYEGDFKYGWRTGQGIYTWSNGDEYHGPFIENKMTGEGKFLYHDGGEYYGGFVDGKKSGYGIDMLSDGSKYFGDFVDGKKSGHGRYLLTDGRIYEGDFFNDMMSGHGECTWPDGSKYDGDFINDMMSGHGEYTWPDGDKYVGKFASGKMTNDGSLVRSDKGQITQSKGNMKFDFSTKSGYGVISWKEWRNKRYTTPDGSLHSESRPVLIKKYEGDIVNGKMEGHGVMTWENGDKYEGEWVDDKRNGDGTYYYKDGRIQSGYCKDDNFISYDDGNSKAYKIDKSDAWGDVIFSHDYVYANPGKSTVQVYLSLHLGNRILIYLEDKKNDKEVCRIMDNIVSEGEIGDGFLNMSTLFRDVDFTFEDGTSITDSCTLQCAYGMIDGSDKCDVIIEIYDAKNNSLTQSLINKLKSSDLKEISILNYSITFENYHSKSTLQLMDSMLNSNGKAQSKPKEKEKSKPKEKTQQKPKEEVNDDELSDEEFDFWQLIYGF